MRGCAGTSNYPKQKILIIGDSHVRGLADNISSNLNDTFYVMGNIKPNANIKVITSSLLTSEEYGTKDISKNE
jgi:hypothetical protein